MNLLYDETRLEDGFSRRFINCLRLSLEARSACGLSFRLASFLE